MKNLGQFLVELGWISREDLGRAQEQQQQLGGTLGTCLLEMGMLSEELLLKALSHQLGCEAAGVQDLRNIPPEVHGLLPAKLAVRCQAVPFRALGSDLYVAMIDINNLSHHDEIAFVTERSVIPHIANEVRLFEAIEKYYGERCPERFRKLLEELNAGSGSQQVAKAEAESGARAGVADAGTTPVSPAHLTSSGPPPPPPPPSAAPTRVVPEYQREAAAARGAAATAPRADNVYDTQGLPQTATRLGYDELKERLASAHDRNDVGVNVLRYLEQHFERALLFMVIRSQVKGWMGTGVNEERFREFRVDFAQPSVFLNLRQGGLFFLGALPAMPPHQDLARCWGGELPAESLLIPVRIRDRLVCVMYGDRHQEGLAGVDIEQFKELAATMANALERCILEKKRARN